MTKWFDQILNKFIPHTADLALICDKDYILSESAIIERLKDKGFELIFYEDNLSFRYLFESQFRDFFGPGDYRNILVVCQGELAKSNSLPYDITAQANRPIDIGLDSIFPSLSYPILQALDHSLTLSPDQTNLFDALFDALAKLPQKSLNDTETKDFILQQIFQFTLSSIQDLPSLFNALLRLHYKGYQLPGVLNQYLIEQLADQDCFAHFPLDRIIPDQQALFSFLQDHWPDYIKENIKPASLTAADSSTPPEQYASAAKLKVPFGNKDVRAYIDSLFLEGYLKPINPYSLGIDSYKIDKNAWFRVGLEADSQAEFQHRFERLSEKVSSHLPSPSAEHTEWLSLALQMAQLLNLWHKLSHPQQLAAQDKFNSLQTTVDEHFVRWVLSQYGTLHYKSPAKPAMVHHIPRFIAREMEAGSFDKVALVLMDGMALDQWLVLKSVVTQQDPRLIFRENAVFAWIPSITSVSRQALFAGKPPIGFPQSIFRTNKEPKLWEQFWVDHGFAARQVGYHAGLRDIDQLEPLQDAISHPTLKILGLVVDKVDRISHHRESGTPNMHEQIRPWAEQGFIKALLNLLIEHRFKVFITADHGNIETTGIGSPAEKAIADYRGQRVRIYPDKALRAQVKERFPQAIEWDSPVIPTDFLPLLAPGRTAFIAEGEVMITHGGISVEELIVPFIQVDQTAS